MTNVTVPSAPPLANIPGVELLRSGEWQISTGKAVFTDDDLAEAVAATDCPGVRNPILKLGHLDDRFNPPGSDIRFNAPDYGPPNRDGQPAVGWVGNLAVRDGGHTLAGDYLGMPGWLATPNAAGDMVITSAYPDRSIEGARNFRCQLGHTHPFVITAVALLGVMPPGIGNLESLQDLGALYGVDAAAPIDGNPGTAFYTVGATGAAVNAAASGHTGAMIALVPSEADAQRLAVPDGEPAADLHVTLMYLGKAADWDAESRAAVTDAVRALADLAPVEADGFSLAMFNPGDATRDPCIVLGLGGAGLDAARTAAISAVQGDNVPEQRVPWIPHLTLVYADDATLVADLTDRTGPVLLDRIRIAWAGEYTDIPLTPSEPADAAHGERSTMPTLPTLVAAGVTTEDVRRAWYDLRGWTKWITEMQLDPTLQLIVADDDDGSYSRVTVTLDGDSIDFADPVPVEVVYVDKTSAVSAAAPASSPKRHVWRTRAESCPEAPVSASTTPVLDGPQIPAAEPATPTTQEDNMSLSTEVRQRLGLADDADEAAVLAALDDTIDKATTPPTIVAPEPVPVAAAALPDGVTTIDKAMLAELRRDAAAGAQARQRQVTEDRDRHIAAAVTAGKIPPARAEHWTKLWDADPDGARTTLDGLAEGLAVPVSASGYTSPADVDTDSDSELEAAMARLDPPSFTTKGA